MRERLKIIMELISVTSSVFAIHRELIAELGKLEPSPEQQAILAKHKGPLAKLKTEFKETVKDAFASWQELADSQRYGAAGELGH